MKQTNRSEAPYHSKAPSGRQRRASPVYDSERFIFVARDLKLTMGSALRRAPGGFTRRSWFAVVASERGGMAEWSMAVVLKTTVPARVPGVRIPLPPPNL